MRKSSSYFLLVLTLISFFGLSAPSQAYAIDWTGFIGGVIGGVIGQGVGGAPGAVAGAAIGKDPVKVAGDIFKSAILEPIGGLLIVLSQLVDWMTRFLVRLLGPLITVSGFITNPVAVSGWTFVQGIANLFFILALLFIALATALHLDGFSARRLLPRLFIAALLLNFSLVLCGVFIDISRLMMAIITTIISGNAQVVNIGSLLLARSNLLGIVVQASIPSVGKKVGEGVAIILLPSILLIFKLLFLFCIIVLIIGLFMRYIMLILLLIASPLAFISWVLPNTAKLAQQWWSKFFHYVMYGPIVLFILAIALNIGGNNNVLRGAIFGININCAVNQGNAGNGCNWIPLLVNLLFTCGMLYIAATVGKSLSGSVGSAMIGFAAGQGKRLGRLGVRAGTAPVRLAGRAAGAGGRYVGKEIKSEAKEGARELYNKTPLANVTDFISKRRELVNKNRQRQEKQRARTSSGTLAALRTYSPQEYGMIQAAQQAGTNANHPGLAAVPLRNRNVQDVVKKEQLGAVVTEAINTPTDAHDAQIEVIVNSPTLAGKMDEPMIQQLMSGINQKINATRNPDEKQKFGSWVGAFNRSLQKANEQPPQNTPPPNAKP